MNNKYFRLSIYIVIVAFVFISPLSIKKNEIKPLYNQNKIIQVSLVKPPKKKKIKKTSKKRKEKPKPKPVKKIILEKPKPKPVVKKTTIVKPKPKPKPTVEKIEPVVVKKDIIEEKEEVNSIYDSAQKAELARVLNAKKTYYDVIYETIAENKRYPKKARRYKQEGSINVSFKVLSDGTIIDLKLLVRSKYKSLNRAVKKLFQSLEKFPPPPDNLSFPLELSITINYKLKR